jgi:glutathione synthase/RimK-type ligase-like ATP-grasp enzyme
MPESTATVLVLTHTADHFTVDRVSDAVLTLGARCYRLDTDLFPTRLRLAATLRSGSGQHAAGAPEYELDLASVTAVWARKLWAANLGDEVDPRYAVDCQRESWSALHGVLDGLHGARWINHPLAESAAENKPRQLRLAAACGLRTPRTLLTNDPARVRAFFDEVGGRMITKMLTPMSVGMHGRGRQVHTSEVAAADLESLDGLRYCPMVFQERIEKDVELRVACVGDRAFAGAIDARRSTTGKTDWRASLPGEVSWQPVEVPETVRRQLAALLRALGLTFGAVDLIRTPEGEHVFLEVNPAGEWGMLERDLDLPISRAIADELLAPRTSP